MQSQAYAFFYKKQTWEDQEKHNKVPQELYKSTEVEGSNWNGKGNYTLGEPFFFVCFFYCKVAYIYPLCIDLVQVLKSPYRKISVFQNRLYLNKTMLQ